MALLKTIKQGVLIDSSRVRTCFPPILSIYYKAFRACHGVSSSWNKNLDTLRKISYKKYLLGYPHCFFPWLSSHSSNFAMQLLIPHEIISQNTGICLQILPLQAHCKHYIYSIAHTEFWLLMNEIRYSTTNMP